MSWNINLHSTTSNLEYDVRLFDFHGVFTTLVHKPRLFLHFSFLHTLYEDAFLYNGKQRIQKRLAQTTQGGKEVNKTQAATRRWQQRDAQHIPQKHYSIRLYTLYVDACACVSRKISSNRKSQIIVYLQERTLLYRTYVFELHNPNYSHFTCRLIGWKNAFCLTYLPTDHPFRNV